MNNPYETLGVPRDAASETIKAAFRLLASANHPDKDGGNSAKMADINAAYAILSDPESRAVFDTTGGLVPPNTIEQEADNILLQLFTQLLDVEQGKLLKQAEAGLKASIENAQAVVRKLRNRTKVLFERRGLITTKDGVVNLVQSLIDQQVHGMATNIAQAERAIQVMTLASTRLDTYESTEVEMVNTEHFVTSTGSHHTTYFRVG